MTTWNIASSRFYSEIMTSLAAFFGSPDASESELHQKLQDSGTLAMIEAKATEEATNAVSAKMDAFQAQLDAVQTKLDEVIASDAVKAEQITALEASLTESQTAATEKDTKITAQAETIKALSSELAGMKVSRPISTAMQPADASLPIAANPVGATNARVVSSADFNKMFNN